MATPIPIFFWKVSRDEWTGIFREIEQEEFYRDIACGEMLKFNESQICRQTTIFPKKIGNKPSEDVSNMIMMHEADLNTLSL